jgi:hypothetical protein
MDVSSVVELARTSGSVALDLRCEREQHATVHTLRWTVDGYGRFRGNECTCNSCPRGANARLWPTAIELQDAGATGRVPASEDPEPAPTLKRSEWPRVSAAGKSSDR